MLVWLPTTFIVALFLWPPSSRLLMVWVLLPVGGLLTVELASFVIRRIFNKLTTHGPYIKVYPHPGFLASQHKYKARRGDAVAPTAHCVPCLSPGLTAFRPWMAHAHALLGTLDNGARQTQLTLRVVAPATEPYSLWRVRLHRPLHALRDGLSTGRVAHGLDLR